MKTEVTVLADSVSPAGVRLTTLLCIYPRFIHSEMLRHRMFSHSVASSRAIPTERNIEQVRTEPFIPSTFNRRVKGMGVGAEFDVVERDEAERLWRIAAMGMADVAYKLNKLGLDKSRANRLLEPFLYVADIITATEWDNFFALRDHPAAQPEFQELAGKMRIAMETSTEIQNLDFGAWHLPLVSAKEMWDGAGDGPVDWDKWKKVSASRCAAISYHKHAADEDQEASLARFARLADATPPHLSPLEHVARPLEHSDRAWLRADQISSTFVGNLKGWLQFRKEYENEGRADLLMTAAVQGGA